MRISDWSSDVCSSDLVLFAGQPGKDAALFGTVADAQVRNAIGGQVDRFGALDADRALARAGQAQNRAQRGGAPRAVTAQQRDHLALRDRKSTRLNSSH